MVFHDHHRLRMVHSGRKGGRSFVVSGFSSRPFLVEFDHAYGLDDYQSSSSFAAALHTSIDEHLVPYAMLLSLGARHSCEHPPTRVAIASPRRSYLWDLAQPSVTAPRTSHTSNGFGSSPLGRRAAAESSAQKKNIRTSRVLYFNKVVVTNWMILDPFITVSSCI